MKIYNLGPDELPQCELAYAEGKNYVWIVYSYERGSWEGGTYFNGVGEAIGYTYNDTLHHINLGHDSYYGPLKNMYPALILTVEEFLAPGEFTRVWNCDKLLRDKAEELLNSGLVFNKV